MMMIVIIIMIIIVLLFSVDVDKKGVRGVRDCNKKQKERKISKKKKGVFSSANDR